MPWHYVTYPIAGTATVSVEAEVEAAAIEAGWDLVGDKEWDEMVEWEAMDHISQGNVLYAPSNNIEVEPNEDGY